MRRINGCFIGAVLVVIYLFGLGSLYFMEDNSKIIKASFLFSVFGGCGNGMNASSTAAILGSYKE